ncbi:TPA: hypothetical protein ACSQRE_001791 [Clostridium perfringens]|nr:hypothetical protein [Clostridium perfringens]HBI6918989.1 hypothetical protein [Clostridium perfringens]HBI7038952.1 hypothetical protein [Clostridium perfringens]
MLKIINQIPKDIEELLYNFDNDESVIYGFEKINKETSHGDIYRISNDYCLKIFDPFKMQYAQCEIDVILKIQGKEYAPKLYAYNSTKYMLIEWIEGYSLHEYVDKYDKLPTNFTDNIYNVEIDMVNSGILYVDTKYDKHIIWLKNNVDKFKLIDYGVCDLLSTNKSIEYQKKYISEKYEKTKKKDEDALNDLRETLLCYGIKSEHIDKFISSL